MNQSSDSSSIEPFKKLIARAVVYLSGDATYFLLGFLVYGWLVRILTSDQYGHLTIASSIYQIFMMVTAIGIDLIGPKYLVGAGTSFWPRVHLLQRIRFKVFLYIVIPVTLLTALAYSFTPQSPVSVFLLVSLSLLFARLTDISYAAISLSRAGAMARARTISMVLYLGGVVVFRGFIHRWPPAVILIQAIGSLFARQMLIWEMKRIPGTSGGPNPDRDLGRSMLKAGVHAGAGQVLMLACNSLDSVWLGRVYPAATVGEYATISRLYLFGTYVLASLLNAYIPSLLSNRTHPSQFRRVHRQLWITSLALGILGGILIWLVGPHVTDFLAHRRLPMAHQVSGYFGWTFLAVAGGLPYYSLLPTLGLEREYLIGVGGSLVILFLGFSILIPWLGFCGAPIAQAVALGALGIYSHHYICHMDPNPIAPHQDPG
jgi:O-antigen/teichoic acid export membrane protein